MVSGGQVGNRNAAKAKRWQKALERGLARAADGDVDDGLDKVADQVVKAAMAGDRDAWKEIAERMDGKTASAPEDADRAAFILKGFIEFVGTNKVGVPGSIRGTVQAE